MELIDPPSLRKELSTISISRSGKSLFDSNSIIEFLSLEELMVIETRAN